MENKKFNNTQFKQVRQILGLNQKEFAEKLGTHQQTIAMIEKGDRDVSKNIRAAFYKNYGISYEEIEACESETEIQLVLDTGRIMQSIFPKEHIACVKFYKDAKAAAGLGQTLPETSEEENLYLDKRFLENILGVREENAIFIQAKGDSMDSGLDKSGDIKDGDLLLVDISIKEIINNKTFVIQQENELRVKKIVKEFNGNIYLISNNIPKYPPELVTKNITIIGKVVWNGNRGNI